MTVSICKDTFAEEIIWTFGLGLKLQSYEFAYDHAVTVREASDHSVLRFADNSEVRIYVSDDHEITITP